MAAKHLFAATELGLFEHLLDAPRTAEELASQVGAPVASVEMVANAVVALGLLSLKSGRYACSPEAQQYLSGATPTDLRPFMKFWNQISFPLWQHFDDAVRTGQSVTQGTSLDDNLQRVMVEGVEAITSGSAHALSQAVDYSGVSTVVDLGGGTGSYCKMLLAAYPKLRASLVELPPVAEVASARLAGSPLKERIEVVSADFMFDPLPAGEVYLIANVFHTQSAEQNVRFLQHLRGTISTPCQIHAVDFWMNETRTSPPLGALMSGEFALFTGCGRSYSEKEYRNWLKQAGWDFIETKPLAGPESVVIAEAR